MSNQEIDDLVERQILCRIAFKGDEYPYIAPFQYTVVDGIMYFHFTDYGKKIKLIDKDKRVCVEIESYKDDLSEYRFVSIQGRLEIVKDRLEKSIVIGKMAGEGRERLSRNFLAVHGLSRSEDWSSLSSRQDDIIVRFRRIGKRVGLKSP